MDRFVKIFWRKKCMQKKQQKAAFVIETLDLQKRKQHFQNPSPKSAHLKGVTCRVAKRQQKGRMRWHKRAGYVLPFCKNTGCVGTTQKKRQESITVANSLCKHRSGKSGAVACCDSIPPSTQNYPTLLSKTYTTALVSDCEVSKQIQTFPLLHNEFENSSCRFFSQKNIGKKRKRQFFQRRNVPHAEGRYAAFRCLVGADAAVRLESGSENLRGPGLQNGASMTNFQTLILQYLYIYDCVCAELKFDIFHVCM